MPALRTIRASPGPDPAPRRPAFSAPVGAVDCHAHLFGPQVLYPYARERIYTPPDAPLADYVTLLSAIGIDRAVLVQGSPQGTDNRIIVDAIATAPDRFRGIAVVEPDIRDRDLEALAHAGIRGIRFSDTIAPGLPHRHLEAFAARIRPLGWLAQIHLSRCHELPALARRIARLDLPVVIDHMAGVTGDDALDAPGFADLVALLRDNDHVWAKIAAFYSRSRWPPPYADMRERARTLAATRPDRLVWGTNWPHPVYTDAPPNDGDLVDLVHEWFPDDLLRRQILVENPTTLFGFAPDARVGGR